MGSCTSISSGTDRTLEIWTTPDFTSEGTFHCRWIWVEVCLTRGLAGRNAGRRRPFKAGRQQKSHTKEEEEGVCLRLEQDQETRPKKMRRPMQEHEDLERELKELMRMEESGEGKGVDRKAAKARMRVLKK